MKLAVAAAAAAPLAALGAALVLPDVPAVQQALAQQAPLSSGGSSSVPSEDAGDSTPQSWWDSLMSSKDDVFSTLGEVQDSLTESFNDAIDAVNELGASVKDQLNEAAADALDGGHHGGDGGHHKKPHRHHGGGGKHDFPDLTIYQLISLSNYTKKFAKLVDEYPSVVKVLNGTKANYTLFVPLDEAFDHIPDDDDHKPSKEQIETALMYHVGLGRYPAKRLLFTHTLPTALEEGFLGDEAQRIRISGGLLSGLRANFITKVIPVDVTAKNGVIHAVRHFIIPPPMAGRLLTLLPQYFSTLLLAYEKTDFVKYIHDVPMVGTTVFAPSNSAWAWLGPRANAFLFNTETGHKYLKALLKFHIVANATLYSDAFYDKTGSGDSGEVDTLARERYSLTSLLDDKQVTVDITRFAGFASMRVNGFVKASVADAIAHNGVLHVVNRVLVPPHPHHKASLLDEVGDFDVEDLMERLGDYVE